MQRTASCRKQQTGSVPGNMSDQPFPFGKEPEESSPEDPPLSLWLDPQSPSPGPLRLPGLGFTLWLDPARWPVPRLKLPGRGFTVWLEQIGRASLPGVSPGLQFSASTSVVPRRLADPVLPITETEQHPEPAESHKPDISTGSDLPPADVPSLSIPPVKPMPITYTQNRAFTLWTKPGHVTSIPMRNGMTAAQLAASKALVAAASPGSPVAATAPGVAPAVSADPGAALSFPVPKERELPVHPPRRPAVQEGTPSPVERWLPLAAGVVAVLGVHALLSAARPVSTTGNTIPPPAGIAPSAVAPAGSAPAAAASSAAPAPIRSAAPVDPGARTQQLEAEARALKQQQDVLVTDLAKAQEEVKNTTARLRSQEETIVRLSAELNTAKLSAATAGTQAEATVVQAMEEASRIKRESQAAVVALQEELAQSEEQKAAAFKSAAESATALAALKAKVEAPPKPAP